MFEWILHMIESGGYTGIFLLGILENLFPPIPSEVVLPLAGFAAASGQLDPVLVIIAASAGTLIGSLPWYFAGRYFTLSRLKAVSGRYGRWITLTPDELEYAANWFNCHGNKAVLLGRLVPVVRTLISVPAGLANMPFFLFLFYSAIGTILWTMLLVSSGFILESQYEKVAVVVNPIADIIMIAILGTYFYRVATFNRRQRSKS